MTENVLRNMASLPFCGKNSDGTRIGKGPRREYIRGMLIERGLIPEEDSYGNLWVSSGSTGEYRLQSSHMDMDATISPQNLRLVLQNGIYRGMLDNVVGCYLNYENAVGNTNGQRTLHVFTASEEEDPTDTKIWARSAHDVVKVLEKKGIRPTLCVAVDCTYPKLLITQEEFDRIAESDVWFRTPAEAMFDFSDSTHCYIDNFSREDARRIAEQVLARNNDSNVRMRDLTGYDEATVYSRIAPSFAFGPVGYGKYTEPEQEMPAAHIKTAERFLRFLARTEIKH